MMDYLTGPNALLNPYTGTLPRTTDPVEHDSRSRFERIISSLLVHDEFEPDPSVQDHSPTLIDTLTINVDPILIIKLFWLAANSALHNAVKSAKARGVIYSPIQTSLYKTLPVHYN